MGAILVLAMLITPATTVRQQPDRLSVLLVGGALLSAVESIAGLYLSWHANVAAGGAIVLVATGVFFLVLVVSPQHGLLAHGRHRQADKNVEYLAGSPEHG